MLAEQQPAEQHAERRNEKVVAAGGRRTGHGQNPEPEQVGEHRDDDYAVGEGRDAGAQLGTMSPKLSKLSANGIERNAGGEALHAVADPESVLRRESLNRMVPPTKANSAQHGEQNAAH